MPTDQIRQMSADESFITMSMRRSLIDDVVLSVLRMTALSWHASCESCTARWHWSMNRSMTRTRKSSALTYMHLLTYLLGWVFVIIPSYRQTTTNFSRFLCFPEFAWMRVTTVSQILYCCF